MTEGRGILSPAVPVHSRELGIAHREIALPARKIANIVQTSPDLAATGNIGCIAQIASGTSIPVLHTIELLDFAHGGQGRMAS
jgi:Fe-S oxidoreductase